jgi:hypothetical protein
MPATGVAAVAGPRSKLATASRYRVRAGCSWMAIAVIILPLLALPNPGSADEAEIFEELKNLPNLPGPPVESPNGRLRLRASFDDRRHRLILEEPATGRVFNLMRIERNADIGWRADSSLFFVNDNFGSNVSDCMIFRPFKRQPLISIWSAVVKNRKVIAANEQEIISSHFYVSCVRWISNNQILGVVSGHYDVNNAPEFKDRYFTYDLTTGAVRRTQP